MGVYAKLLNGKVINTQVAMPEDVFDPNFQWQDITDISPQPCIDWTFDGQNWLPDPNNPFENGIVIK